MNIEALKNYHKTNVFDLESRGAARGRGKSRDLLLETNCTAPSELHLRQMCPWCACLHTNKYMGACMVAFRMWRHNYILYYITNVSLVCGLPNHARGGRTAILVMNGLLYLLEYLSSLSVSVTRSGYILFVCHFSGRAWPSYGKKSLVYALRICQWDNYAFFNSFIFTTLPNLLKRR